MCFFWSVGNRTENTNKPIGPISFHIKCLQLTLLFYFQVFKLTTSLGAHYARTCGVPEISPYFDNVECTEENNLMCSDISTNEQVSLSCRLCEGHFLNLRCVWSVTRPSIRYCYNGIAFHFIINNGRQLIIIISYPTRVYRSIQKVKS